MKLFSKHTDVHIHTHLFLFCHTHIPEAVNQHARGAQSADSGQIRRITTHT